MLTSIKYILIITWFLSLFGCAAWVERKPPAEIIEPDLKWDLKSYAEFASQNIQDMNAKYSEEYVPYEFIVDMDSGSTRIQNLIDLHTAASINMELDFTNPEAPNHISKLHQYVIREYRYVIEPNHWQTTGEAIKSKEGDCKSLSLLLMSMLISAGYDSHAAVSNGHMWVTVHENHQWRVLEIDQDPQRLKIYHIPGFYEYPLFKIFIDHSEKREKKE
jgi:hypothetical protein